MKNRKKISALLFVMCCSALLLCGCCLKHDFAEATCTEPATCTRCGETEGEPLGHSWTEYPTVAAPITCTRCGETQGEAVSLTCPLKSTKTGDTYTVVTFDEDGNELARFDDAVGYQYRQENDKIVIIVQDGERYSAIVYSVNGTKLAGINGLDYLSVLSYDVPDGNAVIIGGIQNGNTCSVVCFDLNGKEVSRIDGVSFYNVIPTEISDTQDVIAAAYRKGDQYTLVVYDPNGNELFRLDGLENYKAVSLPDGRNALCTVTLESEAMSVIIYDLNGKELSRIKLDTPIAWSYSLKAECFMLCAGSGHNYTASIYNYSGTKLGTFPVKTDGKNSYPLLKPLGDSAVASIYDCETENALLYVDVYTGETVPTEQAEAESYVSSAEWGFRQPVPDSDRTFVGKPDRSQWGFVDAKGNVLALYTDASNFNEYGYALASDDRENYFVIDRDFRVVSDTMPGTSAFTNTGYKYLCLENDSGEYQYFVIR